MVDASAPAVTVVIVNFNAGDHLRVCLESVRTDLADVSRQIVVVDNASTDESLTGLDGADLTIVRNSTNRGFGAAANQAAHLRTAPRLLLVNPDCQFRPGTFALLEATLGRHPEAAIAAPQLLNADGTTQESARGEPTAWTGLFGRHSLLSRWFPRAGLARQNLRARDLVASGGESAEVDWVMGAVMLMRRDRFDAVGGFDERFFLYWEDADLCRRLRGRGWTTRYAPGARVTHVGGESARSVRRLAIRAFHESASRPHATHTMPSRWHPARWLAWTALHARAWWRIATARA